jgi:hypothetical protein
MADSSRPAAAALAREEISAELDKILASKLFVNSRRLTAFLRYVVEHTLNDNVDCLKEYPLGLDVFGRPESYDPRADPVVRVEARQLRFKLEAYYKEFGDADEVVISLPKGRYVAQFERREPREQTDSGELVLM